MAASPTNQSTAGSTTPALAPQGKHAGKPSLPISRSFTMVGSRNRAHLHLVSSSVSQVHAVIVNDGGNTYIRDTASREHVIVNGQAVRETNLCDGDQLAIGSFKFKFADATGMSGRIIPEPAPQAALEIDGETLPMIFEGRTLLIGRRPTCDIVLKDSAVSNVHAIIFELNNQHHIRDLGSRTGTFVNGEQIHKKPLAFNDVIRVGDSEMRFVPTGAPSNLDELEHLIGTSRLGAESIALAKTDAARYTAAPAASETPASQQYAAAPGPERITVPPAAAIPPAARPYGAAPAPQRDSAPPAMPPRPAVQQFTAAPAPQRVTAPLAAPVARAAQPLAPPPRLQRPPAAPQVAPVQLESTADLDKLDLNTDQDVSGSGDTKSIPLEMPGDTSRTPVLSSQVVDANDEVDLDLIPLAPEETTAPKPVAPAAPSPQEPAPISDDFDLDFFAPEPEAEPAPLELPAADSDDLTGEFLPHFDSLPTEGDRTAVVSEVEEYDLGFAADDHVAPAAEGHSIDDASAGAHPSPTHFDNDDLGTVADDHILHGVGPDISTHDLLEVADDLSAPTPAFADAEAARTLHLPLGAPVPAAFGEGNTPFLVADEAATAGAAPIIPPTHAISPDDSIDGEVIPQTEPSPESAQQLASHLDQPHADIGETVKVDELSDSNFGRAVHDFTGSALGSLVEHQHAAPLHDHLTGDPLVDDATAFLAHEGVADNTDFGLDFGDAVPTAESPAGGEQLDDDALGLDFSNLAPEESNEFAELEQPVASGDQPQYPHENGEHEASVASAAPDAVELGHIRKSASADAVPTGSHVGSDDPMSTDELAFEQQAEPPTSEEDLFDWNLEDLSALAPEGTADAGHVPSELPAAEAPEESSPFDLAATAADGLEGFDDEAPLVAVTDESTASIDDWHDSSLTASADLDVSREERAELYDAAEPLAEVAPPVIPPAPIVASPASRTSAPPAPVPPVTLTAAERVNLVQVPPAPLPSRQTNPAISALPPVLDPMLGMSRDFGSFLGGIPLSLSPRPTQSAPVAAPPSPLSSSPPQSTPAPPPRRPASPPMFGETPVAFTVPTPDFTQGRVVSASAPIAPPRAAPTVAPGDSNPLPGGISSAFTIGGSGGLSGAMPGRLTASVMLGGPTAPAASASTPPPASLTAGPSSSVHAASSTTSSAIQPAPPELLEVEDNFEEAPAPEDLEIRSLESLEVEDDLEAAPALENLEIHSSELLEVEDDFEEAPASEDLEIHSPELLEVDQPQEAPAFEPQSVSTVQPASAESEPWDDELPELADLSPDLFGEEPELPLDEAPADHHQPVGEPQWPHEEAAPTPVSTEHAPEATETLLESENPAPIELDEDIFAESAPSAAPIPESLSAPSIRPPSSKPPAASGMEQPAANNVERPALAKKPVASAPPTAAIAKRPPGPANKTIGAKPKAPAPSTMPLGAKSPSRLASGSQAPVAGLAGMGRGMAMPELAPIDVFSQLPVDRDAAASIPTIPMVSRAGFVPPGATSSRRPPGGGLRPPAQRKAGDPPLPVHGGRGTSAPAKPGGRKPVIAEGMEDSGAELGLPTEESLQREPVEPHEGTQPEKKKKRWKFPFLKVVLLGLTAGGAAWAWYALPPRSDQRAALKFDGIQNLDDQRRLDFARAQSRTIDTPEFRKLAQAIYEDDFHGHPGEGFLSGRTDADTVAYLAVVDGVFIKDDQLVIHRGAARDASGDADRYRAILKALYRTDLAVAQDTDAKLAARDAEKTQLAQLIAAMEHFQKQLAEDQRRKADFELANGREKDLADRSTTLDKAASDSAEVVAKLKIQVQTLAEIAANPPRPTDDELRVKRLESQLEDAKAVFAAAQPDPTGAPVNPVQKFDVSLNQLKHEIDDVGAVQASAKLAPYLGVARKVESDLAQANADRAQRQRIAEQTQAELKHSLAEKTAVLLASTWSKDAQLVQLEQDLAVERHRLGAAAGAGLTADANRIRVRVESLSQLVKARKDELAQAGPTTDEIKSLQKAIVDQVEQMRAVAAQHDEQIAEQFKMLDAAAPAQEAISPDQQPLVDLLKSKVAAVNAARQLLALSSPTGAPDLISLTAQLSEAQAALDGGRKQLAESIEKSKATAAAALASGKANLESAQQIAAKASADAAAAKKELTAAQASTAAVASAPADLARDNAEATRIAAQIDQLKTDLAHPQALAVLTPHDPQTEDLVQITPLPNYRNEAVEACAAVFAIVLIWTLAGALRRPQPAAAPLNENETSEDDLEHFPSPAAA